MGTGAVTSWECAPQSAQSHCTCAVVGVDVRRQGGVGRGYSVRAGCLSVVASTAGPEHGVPAMWELMTLLTIAAAVML